MRLYVPEVVSVQQTSCNEEPLTPPDVCPSTATPMLLPTNDALDVAKNSCYEMQYASEEDWTLAADEITVVKD